MHEQNSKSDKETAAIQKQTEILELKNIITEEFNSFKSRLDHAEKRINN